MDSDAKPYLLSNSQPQAARRFEALSELFDPWTCHHIEALGIDPTWHCWEIGAGSPTIPKWLAERTTYTLATDIDTSLLDGHFEVVQGTYDGRSSREPGLWDSGVDAPPDMGPREVGGEVAPTEVERREGAAGNFGVGRQSVGGELVPGEVGRREHAAEQFGVGRQGTGGEVARPDVERREGAVEAFGVTRRGGGEVARADMGRRGGSGVVEVRRHDVGVDGSPGEFDFVHARLVLVHVPGRVEALATMVRSLRPGGWLLVEEADPSLQPRVCVDEFGPEQRLANKLKDGFRALMAGRGVDLAYGRTLPRLLRSAGLTEVGADAYFPVTSPACDILEEATVLQIRHRLVAAGLATDPEIDQHLDNVRAGRLDLTISPLISAWGRKPR